MFLCFWMFRQCVFFSTAFPWYVREQSLVMVTHTIPTFRVADFVAIADSLKSISIRLFYYRWHGDVHIIVQNSSRRVSVHYMVVESFHRVHESCLPAFLRCFVFAALQRSGLPVVLANIPWSSVIIRVMYGNIWCHRNRNEIRSELSLQVPFIGTP